MQRSSLPSGSLLCPGLRVHGATSATRGGRYRETFRFQHHIIIAVFTLGVAGGQRSPLPYPVAIAREDQGLQDDAPTATHDHTLLTARELLMEGYYEKALEAYTALAKDPRFAPKAAIGLARTRLQVGQYAEAVAGLTGGGRRSSLPYPAGEGQESSLPYPARSADWHYVLAQLYGRLGDYEAVLGLAESACKLDKQHAGARLLLGETLELLGRRDRAIEVYRWFDKQVVERPELPPDPEWITSAALGFLRYSVLTRTDVARRTQHVLNEMLQIAYGRLDRTYSPARIAAADLLRQKFNNDEQDGSVSDYKAALRINSNLCEAHVGLGEVALEEWKFEEVERRAELALSINPNHAPALHLLAMKLIVERRYEQALETCVRALKTNPNDLVALSIGAGAGACRLDDRYVEELRLRVETVNPRCALFHHMMAVILSGVRQYARAETAFKKAIEFDGTDANIRTGLGMMYMQWGIEERAREVLEASWSMDPFNQRTKFTLELLEQLEGFARFETDHFIVKYDRAQDPGLGEFVADYLEGIYGTVTGDYDAPLAEKTIIEMFPTQRAFAVRITGKPWIHTVGACTGRVIAMASPRKSVGLMGPYNLARVLTHEFAHTVTLAATHNRIPHWFTEGLAVYQENSPRSFGWWELLADAARRDETFTLESIDWGFVRPRRPGDRQRAYAQSEMMCEFIVERFGYDTIVAMLERFRDGQKQEQVFVEQMGLEPEEFDSAFQAWAREGIAQRGFDLTPPQSALMLRGIALLAGDDAGAHGKVARAEWDNHNTDDALTFARRALELDENNRDGLEIAGRILVAKAVRAPNESTRREHEDEALPLLERLMEVDLEGWTGPKLLAEILLGRKELDRAAEPLERLQRVCPMDPASWRGLAGIYMERGAYDLALPQLLELARTEENDPDVPGQIALIFRRRGRLREAQYWYRQALFINPFGRKLHQALGDTSMRAGDTRTALAQYKTLTVLEPTNAKYFEQAAFASHKLGDAVEARKLAARAVELDPASSARSLVD